jgi:Sec-independent protein translocase protein TatA
MRAAFGVISLLVVLAIVGIVAMKQLKTVNSSVGASLPPAQSGTETAAAEPAASNVAAQSRQLQQRVADDVAKAVQQDAARKEEADK